MNKLLKRYNPPNKAGRNRKYEKIMTNTEIESLIKKLTTNESPEPDGITGLNVQILLNI